MDPRDDEVKWQYASGCIMKNEEIQAILKTYQDYCGELLGGYLHVLDLSCTS